MTFSIQGVEKVDIDKNLKKSYFLTKYCAKKVKKTETPQNHPKTLHDFQTQGHCFKIAMLVMFSAGKNYKPIFLFVSVVRHLNFCMQSYILGIFRDTI